MDIIFRLAVAKPVMTGRSRASFCYRSVTDPAPWSSMSVNVGNFSSRVNSPDVRRSKGDKHGDNTNRRDEPARGTGTRNPRRRMFGSGWMWLVRNRDSASAPEETANADTPIRGGRIPLLACDVREHACCLDYRNERARYLDADWQGVNWEAVARRCEGAPERV
jgi:hypothetical protein